MVRAEVLLLREVLAVLLGCEQRCDDEMILLIIRTSIGCSVRVAIAPPTNATRRNAASAVRGFVDFPST